MSKNIIQPTGKVPKHVAIIPDGNRRWAKKNNLKPWEGHYEGAQRFEELVDAAFDLGVRNLTFWGSSADNLAKRTWRETKALLDIYEKYFKRLIQDERVFKNKIKINIIGRWQEQFPQKLIKLLKKGIDKTKHHDKFNLNFLLAYNGDDDLETAVKNIVKQGLSWSKITKQTIQDNLLSKAVKQVDLVIRTGVENDPHNSAGFLMWQTQNSQLYFDSAYFPDFTAEYLQKAVTDFQRRQRRLGA